MPLTEKFLIERIRRRSSLRGRGAGILQGIGDDCARLRIPSGFETLVTTDLSVEGVHFRRDWHPPESVGHRCLTRGLSDIAAMGGEPVGAFLSLGLPPKLPQSWVDRFLEGLLRLARRFGVRLAGGDTSESPRGVVCDIVLVGQVPRGRAILRSRARPGDSLYVTGELGRAAAVLDQLRRGSFHGKPRSKAAAAHFFPSPRLEIGLVLRQWRLATAMIDVSDGLSTDLEHLCRESGIGAVVAAESIPRPEVRAGLDFALHGGDDYELLFTSRRPVPKRIAGVPVTRIGEVVSGGKIWLADGQGRRKALKPKGWEHFR
ncbi:MAG TPA: thiamine-phosphate kinase [Terriglobales bacterium]|nr:thiamine-phosphate kinase [Terriglobales bacterium]